MRARDVADREKQREKREEATWDYIVAVIASEAEIEAFMEKLDRHDSATVEALMENEEELIETRRRLAEMFSNAHRLDDGRVVFETRDGTKVYDEHGNEVSADVVTPDQIDDGRPKWEDIQEERARQKALEKEREELQRHQEKVDEAREAAADPNVSEDKLKALEAELEASAPERVRRKVEEPKPEDDPAPVPEQAKPAPVSAPVYAP